MICRKAAIMARQNSNYNCLTGLCKRKMGRNNCRTVKGKIETVSWKEPLSRTSYLQGLIIHKNKKGERNESSIDTERTKACRSKVYRAFRALRRERKNNIQYHGRPVLQSWTGAFAWKRDKGILQRRVRKNRPTEKKRVFIIGGKKN